MGRQTGREKDVKKGQDRPPPYISRHPHQHADGMTRKRRRQNGVMNREEKNRRAELAFRKQTPTQSVIDILSL